ncbi:MAG: DUF2505 family protein, partial [Polyangiaceae bacterium]|nr:DUF2505 family protein [Polyangiaceae bacterium]
RGPERIVRHVRLEPEREIPAPMAKLLGGKKLTLDEELEYEVGRYRGRFRTTPGVLPGKVSISGTLAFEALPGGVRRIVEGQIVVSVFAIGGMVEKHVVGNLEKSYGDAAAFTRKWLEGAR